MTNSLKWKFEKKRQGYFVTFETGVSTMNVPVTPKSCHWFIFVWNSYKIIKGPPATLAAPDFSKTGWDNTIPLTHPWSYSSSPHCRCPSGSCTWHDAVTRHCRERFQWTRHQPRTCAHPRVPWTCWWAEPLSLLVRACSGWHTKGRTTIVSSWRPGKWAAAKAASTLREKR